MGATDMKRIAQHRTRLIQELVDTWHRTDDSLDAVYHFELPGADDLYVTVLLLQVTQATPPSADEVVTYGFTPSRDFPFPLALAQVTPEEWERVQTGSLALPNGWDPTNAALVKPAV